MRWECLFWWGLVHKVAVDFHIKLSEPCQVAQSLVLTAAEFEAELLVSSGLWD